MRSVVTARLTMVVSPDIPGIDQANWPPLSPERVSLRDALVEALASDDFNIFKSTWGTDAVGNPTISFRRRRVSKKSIPDQNDLQNPASFLLSFNSNDIAWEMHRPTGIRVLAHFCYEDPLLFERLGDALERVGVRLEV